MPAAHYRSAISLKAQVRTSGPLVLRQAQDDRNGTHGEMIAKDLTRVPPRRWNERLDGIPWLPRLIDKASASNAGTLGTYLYGQSPMDTRLLHILGLGHGSFERIVAEANDDRAVLAAIAARDGGALDRGRAWANGFEFRNGP